MAVGHTKDLYNRLNHDTAQNSFIYLPLFRCLWPTVSCGNGASGIHPVPLVSQALLILSRQRKTQELEKKRSISNCQHFFVFVYCWRHVTWLHTATFDLSGNRTRGQRRIKREESFCVKWQTPWSCFRALDWAKPRPRTLPRMWPYQTPSNLSLWRWKS